MISRDTSSWKWWVCGLLLAATMINYLDRQTLSLTITEITQELRLDNQHYGDLEKVFGYAFAAGGLFFGLLADRVSVRWLYPVVFLGWSLAGAATAAASRIGSFLVDIFPRLAEASEGDSPESPAYWGLMLCRGCLGFFEAGHWPCAVVTTRRLLRKEDRPLGNSLLQSGASLGAIFAPLVIVLLVKENLPGSWRTPYVVLGFVGAFWVVPWVWMTAGSRLSTTADALDSDTSSTTVSTSQAQMLTGFISKFLTVLVIVITINLTWQFYRAWLPKFLREYHDYGRDSVAYFVSAYYIATDLGCIAVGFIVKGLASRGWEVHRARAITFFVCASLTSLGFLAASMPRGPGLLIVLLLIGLGALGLFPTYYSLAQELTQRYTGMMMGLLGAATWIITGLFQTHVGKSIDDTGNYSLGIQLAAAAPLLGVVAILLGWNPWWRKKPIASSA